MPTEKTVNTHFNEAQMDRRLKLYRDANVHESGNSVQCFFTKALASLNPDASILENVKVVNSFSGGDLEILAELQDFIERNGKPCCLNLITERDTKFLKNLEKQQQHQAKPSGEEQEGEDKGAEGSHEE